MKKIAIGLPVFNGEAYLPQALDSILSQTYADFDLIISDNASGDGTEGICRDYARRDSRIHYRRQAINVGAAANYNFVFQQCDSQYFKWAAHDDVLHPRFLEATVEALDSRSEIVLASPASALIDEAGELLISSPTRGEVVDRSGVCWPRLPEDNPGLTASDPAVRFEAVMLKMVMAVEMFGLIRRSALMHTDLHGKFVGSDKVLLAQLAIAGPFWLGPEVLFYRRCHSKQFSSTKSGTYRAAWFSGQRETIARQQFRLLSAYCRSVRGAHLSPWQQANCFRSILQRALFRSHPLRRLTNGLVGNS